ncbi:hypothetical protein AB8810_06905 [Xanthomonas sp. NCPPB 3005]|uniref:hypothetical protein n=1 Tax=Xanthomonas sp. NCPPB 3005 TaxID=3240913 RepID=UPI003513E21E
MLAVYAPFGDKRPFFRARVDGQEAAQQPAEQGLVQVEQIKVKRVRGGCRRGAARAVRKRIPCHKGPLLLAAWFSACRAFRSLSACALTWSKIPRAAWPAF